MRSFAITGLCLAGIVLAFFFLYFLPLPFISFVPDQISNPFDNDKEYFLILGVDDAGEAGSDRTDVIAVAGFNNATSTEPDKSILDLLTIPRDILVQHQVEGENSEIKINSIYKREGLEGLKQKLDELFDITISRYAVVDYQLFKYLGDLVGPIPVNVEFAMHYDDIQQDLSIHFERGAHEFYGDDLLKYIRFRNDPKGDLGRMERQKEVVKKVFSRLKSKITLDFLNDEFQTILNRMKTDFSTRDLLYLFLQMGDLNDISFYSVPFIIGTRGELYIDQSRIDGTLKAFKEFEVAREIQESKVCILNNSDIEAYKFSIINDNILNKSDLDYFIIKKSLSRDLLKHLPDEDLILMLNNDNQATEDVKEKMKALYDREFNIYNELHGGVLEDYYRIVDYLTSNKAYYPYPSDLFVILNGAE